jgi:hypothetical protein
MQSVSSTMFKIGSVVLCSCIVATTTFAQENSPFSRYALGNFLNTQHVANKGMGGIAVAYADGQSINFSNPATFSNARLVTYDIGIMIDSRTLRNANPVEKYNSANFTPAYLAVSMPISAKKRLGFAFGFRPLTRVNYSIIRNERLTNIDSLQSLFEGTGGLNQVYFGVGKRFLKKDKKNPNGPKIPTGLSAGLSTGYNFGRKETSTKRALINDTVAYYKSNYSTTTSFGGVFLTAGLQYELMLDTAFNKRKAMTDRYYLRFGANADLGQKLYAGQDFIKETFDYDNSGATYKIDSIAGGTNLRGRINIPTTYTAGLVFQKTSSDASGVYDIWTFGVEYTTAKWSEYSFYNQKDATVDNWQFKVGGQWVPNPKNIRSYWSRVNYRAGFNFGKDYINADGKELKNYGITFGLGLPVRPARFSYQFTTIHTALEFGRRGSAVNNVTEGYLKLSVGLSLSDIWFIKRKYD